jgi:hypothetical protein
VVYKGKVSKEQLNKEYKYSYNWTAHDKAEIENSDYFDALIKDAYQCLRDGEEYYLFTQEQVDALAEYAKGADEGLVYNTRFDKEADCFIARRKKGMKK